MKSVFLFFSSLFLSCFLIAQNPGDFDPSFGGIGYVTHGGNYDCDYPKVFLMADGRIVTGASCSDGFLNTLRVHRYLADGSLDGSFGQGGVAEFQDAHMNSGHGAGSIALQSDGKVLLLNSYLNGSYGFIASRLNVDGTVDASFGLGGSIVETYLDIYIDPSAILTLSNGKFLVVGSYEEDYVDGFFAKRYNNDGSLDLTYGFQGMAKAAMPGLHSLEVRKAILDPSENILLLSNASDPVNSHYNRFIRFTAAGAHDTNFGQSGNMDMLPASWLQEAYGMTTNAVGEIFVTGTGPTMINRGNMALWKFHADGTPDLSFGVQGVSELNDGFADDMGFDVLIQPDGMILVAGAAEGMPVNDRFFVARFHPDGSPEFGFGTGGIATPMMNQTGEFHEGWSVALQPDGKIVVAGTSIEVIQGNYGPYDSKFTVARYMGGPVNQQSGSMTNKEFEIYPNPASARTMVEVELDETEQVTLSIKDLYGREMKTKVIGNDFSASHYRMLLDLDALQSGNYIVEVKAGTVTHKKRLVIAN